MSFASPGWLFLLLLAGMIPLFHSRPRRDVEVSSLILWRHATNVAPPRASRKVPVPNLLMLLQVLVVALVALAMARPMFGALQDEVDHWVVLLDASGGMGAAAGGSTSFDAAREYLAGELRRTEASPPRVSLVSVTGRPSVIAARLPRLDPVRDALGAVEPSHTAADWHAAAALLAGLRIGEERTRVTVLTNGVGAEGAESAIAGALGDATVETISFGGVTANRALVGVHPTLLDPTRGVWRITGEVRTFGGGTGASASSVPLRVLFEPEGASGALEWGAFQIDEGGDGIFPFDVEVTLPGAGVLELRLEEDALPQDDRAHFVLYDGPREARVLYVGRGNPPLERALAAVPGVTVEAAEDISDASSTYDLVVVDGVPLSVRPPGHVLWLGVPPVDLEAPPLEEATPSAWLEEHPLARSVDWSALTIRAARRFPVLPGAEVVLESAGHPLVQARTTESGREVVVAFGLADTDWPDLFGFPAFVANLLRWTVPDVGQSVATPCRAGEPCPLEPLELAGGASVLGPSSSVMRLPSLYVTIGEAAAGEAWLPRAAEAVFTPQRGGAYVVESNAGRRSVAVHATVQGVASLGASPSLGPPPAVSAGRSRLPAWGLLLLMAVAALCAEGWIAGRRSERFLRRDGLARGNPLAPRRRMILGLRLLQLSLLILAVADFRGLHPVREAGAIVVVDDDGAENFSHEAARPFLSAAGQESSRARRLGSVRVGPDPRVASDLGAGIQIGDTLSPTPAGADLGASLELAAALLPRDATGRIVLVSDGRETRGALANALPGLISRGVPVDVLRLPASDSGDVSVDQVSIPRAVRPGEVTPLQGIVHSRRETRATVRLWREGALEEERVVDLVPGRNRVEFEIVEEEVGVHLYEVDVSAEGDGFSGNDRDGLLVEVRPAARVAIVTPQGIWGRSLADALAIQGVEAEVTDPAGAPVTSSSGAPGRLLLSDFDVVALMNVPARDLPPGTAEALQSWVRDAGGGVVLLGGENTFGPGGYFDTPLEGLSPLSAKIPQETPNLAIMFVLDRSGSMSESVGEGTRLDVAKVATLEAVDLLDPESYVGVVAFDNEAHIVVPIQPAGNREAVRAQLERLTTGGGTWIFSGLALGFVQLSQVDSTYRRHIVLMTDGLSRNSDFGPLMGAIVGAGITVSTAAIGRGADVRLLEQLAAMGGGAAHATTDFGELPSILAREATRFSSGAVREEPLTPGWRSRDAPFLDAFPDHPPQLHGYVRTTAKPGARVHLEGADDTPLLASWRYGLGRVVSFASHGAGPWAADWMSAPDYSTWWSQVVRWTAPGAARPGLNVHVSRDRDYGRIVVEAVRPDGAADSGLALEASIAAPGGASIPVTLRESEPGIYEGSFVADHPGAYAVSVSVAPGAPAATAATAEGRLYVGYSARHATGPPDHGLLEAVALASGGRILEGGERIFQEPVPVRWVRRSMWPFWAALALALFLLELIGRYTSLLRVPRLPRVGAGRRTPAPTGESVGAAPRKATRERPPNGTAPLGSRPPAGAGAAGEA